MKDSLLLRKKIKPKKFLKKKTKVEASQQPHISLQEKVKNLTVKIPKPKLQIPNKPQIPNFKQKNVLNFNNWNLFGIWKLKFGNSLLKRFELDLQLLLIPGILLVILAIITHYNQNLAAQIGAVNIAAFNQADAIHPYPLVNAAQVPDISAKTAIVLDVDSQVPVFSKNPDLRFSMASTTKIMTSLVALDYYKPDSVLTIQSSAIPGTILGLLPGQRLTFLNLFYAMLLPSDNDAAIAIADNYPGGQPAFVKAMNEKARQLHLTNTHFSDPDGLDDDGDYTTVIDMSRLASAAMKNSLFTQVTSTKQKVITDLALSRQYVLTNSNQLLGIDGVTGMKTGTTEGAGEVLVSSAVINTHTYIIVVMNSTNRFADTRILLNFLRTSVIYIAPTVPQK